MSKILLWIEATNMLLTTFPSAHLLRPTLLHIMLEPLLSTITTPSVNALTAVYGPHIMIMSWLMTMFLWSGLFLRPCSIISLSSHLLQIVGANMTVPSIRFVCRRSSVTGSATKIISSLLASDAGQDFGRVDGPVVLQRTGAGNGRHFSPRAFDDVVPRPAHTIPKNGDGVTAPSDLVHLHHPGYNDQDDSLLFTLPTCSVNTAGQPCVEFLVAWQGCYALAMEQRGFFTMQRERTSDRVPEEQGLMKGHYWYHTEDHREGDLYATLCDFRSWRFNPERMPSNWLAAVPWRGVEDDDQEEGDCAITGEDGAVQKAHLVEKTEWQWWVENNMMDHAAISGAARSSEVIGNETTVPGNLIVLSDGLHRLWDRNFFCLFPLRVAAGTWRLHCLFLQPLEKAVRKHHQRPIRGGLRHCSAACAWSRFVSSICRKYEATFLSKPVKRYLGGSKAAAKWVHGDVILQRRQDKVRNTSPRKKSRSGSPQKRQGSPTQADRLGALEGASEAMDRSEEVESDEADSEWNGRRTIRSISEKADSAVGLSGDSSPVRGRSRERADEDLWKQEPDLDSGSRKRPKIDKSEEKGYGIGLGYV
ncbi:hypothetical protein LTR56_020457 [Elasticomyces elasticus]|nr:hypothetical protein LTR56_020457 [Elasticomyces elasticus]KAK3645827.1 hypothetical protein LTR22_014595 [Elasticomyces elasticus]KAK4910563.1 hypothetical protein LTR49_020767 [Elasticomyces elasticus]KAK5742296.1 hypothetical protein LTS12_024290 [Elasticomyces elasticus]